MPLPHPDRRVVRVAAPSAASERPGVGARLRAAVAVGVLAIALGATFSLYGRPGLILDLGQLMAFCGLR
jgi:hypothetical protein